MMWIVCAIISILLLVFCVCTYLQKERGHLRVISILVSLFVAAYIAYLPVYVERYDLLSGLLGAIIRVLQVITIDADLVEHYDIITAGIASQKFLSLYMLVLSILHVSLPLVSALTAVTVLLRCFSSLQLYWMNCNSKPIFVFSEVNEASIQLAEGLGNIKCGIIFASSRENELGTDDAVTKKYIFREETIADIRIKIKKNKEIYFFCLSENEDDSLTCSLQLMEKYSKRQKSEQEHIHIFQFTKYEDFSVFVDSANKGMLDVQCVNVYERVIYDLLSKWPLYTNTDTRIHVLLHGLSKINQIALKTILWCGQVSGYSLCISVVGTNITSIIEELKLSTPGMFTAKYNVNFYDCQTEVEVSQIIHDKCADANYIIACEPTDNETILRGIDLRRMFYKIQDGFESHPYIFCFVKQPVKMKIAESLATAESNAKRKVSYDLIPFGNLAEIYTYDALVCSENEQLAKNVHLAYEEIFSDGEIDVHAAMQRYGVFEVNKRSNRANALHIRYKLDLLGLDYVEGNPQEGVRMEDYYNDKVMKSLAYSEHDRWRAFLESEGWITATKKEVEAYRSADLSRGRHNCPILKMHPYICEYEALKELSIELEGKDTTVYDEELILRIPDILSDKWGVNGKTYKIVPKIHN